MLFRLVCFIKDPGCGGGGGGAGAKAVCRLLGVSREGGLIARQCSNQDIKVHKDAVESLMESERPQLLVSHQYGPM